jgi:hypothetical protein
MRGRLDRALLIGRRVDQDFIHRRWNEFEALATIDIGDLAACSQLLKLRVESNFLFKPRRNGRDWGHPVRLGRLRLVHTIVPVQEVIGDRIRSRIGEDRRRRIGWRICRFGPDRSTQHQTSRAETKETCSQGRAACDQTLDFH